MTAQINVVKWLLGLAGAVAGGIAGFFIFYGLCTLGRYALVVPGAVLGLAAGALLKGRMPLFGVLCALLALLLGFFCHWWMRIPSDGEEPGFFYLLTHANHISAVFLVMIALGALCAFWFGQGGYRK